VFIFLIKIFDEFYTEMKNQNKYSKNRVKVDLKHFKKHIQGLKFNNEEMVQVVYQKIDSLIGAPEEKKEND
jgi:hypothetical protein